MINHSFIPQTWSNSTNKIFENHLFNIHYKISNNKKTFDLNTLRFGQYESRVVLMNTLRQQVCCLTFVLLVLCNIFAYCHSGNICFSVAAGQCINVPKRHSISHIRTFHLNFSKIESTKTKSTSHVYYYLIWKSILLTNFRVLYIQCTKHYRTETKRH